ncbi:McrC family protein [Kordia jejudonensis]|uniref:McrC family protein n=1 Tax=Kordia jejudonensis TaxID=1348245 RepID=UPI00062985CC|nr:hypothetical protein [Kordia jejudonensis]
MRATKLIQVFEHETLRVGASYINMNDDAVVFTRAHLNALRDFNTRYESSFFKIQEKSVKFSSYVGVVQIEDVIIEILPKIDKVSDDKRLWRDVLIHILKITEDFKIRQTDTASVRAQRVHLLDIFFEAYIKEVRTLVRKGLIKKYISAASNKNVLKGRLQFEKHCTKNLIHKTRFFTTQHQYTTAHALHFILAKALQIIASKNKGTELYKNCQKLLLHFPEFKHKTLTKKDLESVKITRKNAYYEKAIQLAKVIILNLGPDIVDGKQEMIALLFDMNALWEKYVLKALKREKYQHKDLEVEKNPKCIWKTNTLKPDIVIYKGEDTYILDTKWKILKNTKTPGSEDIRQIYTYCKFWNSKRGVLIYPSHQTVKFDFHNYENDYDEPKVQAAIGEISVFKNSTKDKLLFDTNLGAEILKQIGVEKI